MMDNRETIVIESARGFHYHVDIHYKPWVGFATGYFNGSIIAQVELNKIHEPHSDDDREWEAYEERLAEWKDEMKLNIRPICETHFNQDEKHP